MNHWIKLPLIIMVSLLTGACSTGPLADLVLINGKVATVNAEFEIAESVAVRADKIVFVGSNDAVMKFVGKKTKVIDCTRLLIIPGLIEGHGHLMGYGKALERLDLVGTKSYQEILKRVALTINGKEPGEWILGRGWDQNEWQIQEFPQHELLSKIAPDNPVYLTRIDGHAGLANAKAMLIAGVNAGTVTPAGGRILKDSNGLPTGIFIDNAEDIITDFIPRNTTIQRGSTIKRAVHELIKFGLTGFHDAGVPPERVSDFKELIDQGELGIRVYAMLSDTVLADMESFLKANEVYRYGNNELTVRSIKMYSDGALGSRGAALLEPYTDRPDESGLILTESDHLLEVARASLATGFQMNTHSIGDAAIRATLNVIEQALSENPTDDHRFRIEHSQIVSQQDIPRYKELGVIPSVQPPHTVSDMNWTEDRVGPERVKGAYAFRAFISAGCILPCGSDVPVESPDPINGIYRAVTRQDENGLPDGGWYPEQRMTVEEALKGYTIWAAYAAFQEDIVGSIEVGKLADFTIIDKDILTIPAKEILTTKPVYTIIGGKILYQAN